MTSYYRNEYLFSEIYLQEITQQPEDTEILASLTTLKEYREFARTAASKWQPKNDPLWQPKIDPPIG